MATASSTGLRRRIVAVVEERASRDAAVARFSVGGICAIRLM
jgi:hypothetical protein